MPENHMIRALSQLLWIPGYNSTLGPNLPISWGAFDESGLDMGLAEASKDSMVDVANLLAQESRQKLGSTLQ